MTAAHPLINAVPEPMLVAIDNCFNKRPRHIERAIVASAVAFAAGQRSPTTASTVCCLG